MFLKIGHRGAKAYATENTLESFRKAVELGANAIELDVRRTGDAGLVICHDDNLKRVFGKDIPVGITPLKQLKQETGGQMPGLEEALKDIGSKIEKILIELKEPGYEEMVLHIARKAGLTEKIIVISFHEPAIEQVRRLDHEIETGLIYAKHKNPVGAAMKLSARYLVALYRFVHRKDIEKAHGSNLKLIVWTINNADDAKAYIAKGVDGIATDKPDIFREVFLGQKAGQKIS